MLARSLRHLNKMSPEEDECMIYIIENMFVRALYRARTCYTLIPDTERRFNNMR
jgi:hypothetical protein